MNIQGGPEELATFIRALNDEPIYIVEDRPREVAAARPAPRTLPALPAPGWLAFFLFCFTGICLLIVNL